MAFLFGYIATCIVLFVVFVFIITRAPEGEETERGFRITNKKGRKP